MKRILVTGFGPFGSYKVNPTEDLVRDFKAPFVIGHYVFPTSYDSVRDELPELLIRTKPDAVIAFGLAPRATAIRLEYVARHKSASQKVDVNGQALAESIDEFAPEYLPSTLPLKSIAPALNGLGLVYEASNNAGGYVCNLRLPSKSGHLTSRAMARVRGCSHGNKQKEVHIRVQGEAAHRVIDTGRSTKTVASELSIEQSTLRG